MRIAIREQLAALVLLAVLIALAIVSIPTWIYVNNFVVDVESNGLALTASLKAAQISSEIELVQTSASTIATRLLVQSALESFYAGNISDANWLEAAQDLESALNSGGASNLLQVRLYARNDTGDGQRGLLNVTGDSIAPIVLPYKDDNGSEVLFGDTEYGYPPMLFPNITYSDGSTPDPANPDQSNPVARPYPDVRIDSAVNGLILGPLVINETYALISLTVPIRKNTAKDYILGYMTIVAEATPLINIASSKEGTGKTGTVLIIGPATGWNRFSRYNLPAQSTTPAAANFSDVEVKFVLPPRSIPGQKDRHSDHNFASGNYDDPFVVSAYNAVYKAFTSRNPAINNASSSLSTTNEQGLHVAVGYARPQTGLVNWTLVIEQERSEAYIPITTLQNILLACVFGTAGLVVILIIPCAHLSVKPISRLKSATEKSIAPPGYAEAYVDDVGYDDDHNAASGGLSSKSEKGMLVQIKRFVRGNLPHRAPPPESIADSGRAVFKIPGKVADRKHYITDELTELTTTFNEMSDELLRQYTSLEEKVNERTRQLEISKKAAEAANESKTLFIANISHELKTPLNGILGLCAVCMEEDDISRIKSSLKMLYESGDLLFHLLEDLLSFSKNQIGQQLKLTEKEFRLGGIKTQVQNLFSKQVREGQITFSVNFIGSETETIWNTEPSAVDGNLPALGPPGTGRLKDMCLWGDPHRIAQVLINLVSNSLKFTPPGGTVAVRIRCVREIERSDESRTSSFSKGSRTGRSRHRVGSSSNQSTNSKDSYIPHAQFKEGTVLAINPMDPKATPHVHVVENGAAAPPPNAKSYLFEFEVEDTGPGIPDNMQDRVFEPFVQADLGLSRKYGGTGLGLSICQQLAVIMGGSIELRSTLGVGTTFTMQIPLKYTQDRASSTSTGSVKSRTQSVHCLDSQARMNPSIISAQGKMNGDAKSNSDTATTVNGKADSGMNVDFHTIIDSKTIMEVKTPQEAKAKVTEQQQPRLVGWSAPYFANDDNGRSTTSDEAMKAVERARASKGGGKLRVLVAEDNPTNIEVVSRMLKLEDIYDVTIAKDGQEAYDMVKENMEHNRKFDVIFMDIQMPNVDGLQSTRLIRQMGYAAPIVALTAFSEESNVKECMASGMNEFLSKPIRRPALKQVLKKFATIPEEPEISPTKPVVVDEDDSKGDKSDRRRPSISTRPVPPESPDETRVNGQPVLPAP
ncbi:osmosensing histidine protein kinase SLN1 [Xylariomycetidae sp. FL2044]|nr:osmosensing histidine protein kinase SLN1 [Xylariomycetidae sp. FL2044]